MHDNPDLLNSILNLIFDFWGYLAAGIIAMFVWVGKRQIQKFDEVMENYVHQTAHEKSISDIEAKMLRCQQSIQEDQRRLYEELRKHSESSLSQGEKISAVHRRIDELMKILMDYMGKQH